jgi:DNA-binding NarL/FixJ family response regulator
VGSGSPASSEAAEVENSQCDVLLTDQFSAKTSTKSFLFRDQWANLQGEILLLGMEEDQELFLAAVGAGATGYLLQDASAGDVVAAARHLARRSGVSAATVYAVGQVGLSKGTRGIGASC